MRTRKLALAEQPLHRVVQRLVDLGYDEEDCFFPGMDDLVRKGGPLTERGELLIPQYQHILHHHTSDFFTTAAWQHMRTIVVERVEYNQLIRIRTGEFDRMECARVELEPYYQDLADAHKGPETFPTFQTFCQLPSVRSLWVPEDAVVTPEHWMTLQPALAGDIKKADRHLRVTHARHIIWDLKRAGLEYDKGLADSLTGRAPLSPRCLPRFTMRVLSTISRAMSVSIEISGSVR